MSKKEQLQREMLESIRAGGAWFSIRDDNNIKIGYSPEDDCYIARECRFRESGLEGGAYTFGTDWFDISFHGKYIDIYVDPETFRRWPVVHDASRGTHFESAKESAGIAERVLEFCKQADAEALAGVEGAYKIDGANFDKVMELSDGKA